MWELYQLIYKPEVFHTACQSLQRKEQQLVNPGTVQANLVSKQFIIALTNCDESFPKVCWYFYKNF